MAVIRQLNLLNQMRIDVPHIRSMESSIAGDFDVVVGRALAGSRPLVVRGFTLSSGTDPTTLALTTADGIIYNVNATESGSFLWVPTTRVAEVLNPATNARVSGSWTPGAINYIGLDMVRATDSSTSDTVQFKNLSTSADDPRIIPLGRTLDYRIVISTIPFSVQPNLVPVAKITLSSSGIISTSEDARSLMYRLGAGGDLPSNTSVAGWSQGRLESGVYAGGDKGFRSQKDWMDGVMTRIWEIGGGERWFSGTADRNVHMVPTGALTAGDYYTWSNPGVGVVGTFTWGTLRFLFDNSTVIYNDVSSGTTSLNDGDCVYVDLDRSTAATLTAQVAPLVTLGVGPRPGSRFVIAWRKDGATSLVFTRDWRYPVGTTFTPASTTLAGVVKLNNTAGAPSDPVVPSIMSDGQIEVTATGSHTGHEAAVIGRGSLTISGSNVYGYGVRGEGTIGVSGLSLFNSAGATGVAGVVNSTNATAYGVYGASIGTSGWGGYFSSTNGAAIYGTGLTQSTLTGGGGLAITNVVAGDALSIDLLGGAPAGSYGISITKASSTGAAIKIISNSSTGDSLNIVHNGSTGNGVGIYGNHASGDPALSVSNVSTTQPAVAITAGGSQPALKSNGGGVSIPAANDYKYNAVQTHYLYVHPCEFRATNASGIPENTLIIATTSGADTSYWTGAVTIVARVRVPKNATITSVDVMLSNNTGSTQAPPTMRLSSEMFSGAPTGAAPYSKSSSTLALSNVAASTAIVQTVAASLGTNSDGSALILIEFDMSANIRMHGVKVTYTTTFLQHGIT